MIILDTNDEGQPLDLNYIDLFLNSHRFYNSATKKVILFDDFFEWKEFMDQNYPPDTMPEFTWDIPSNAIVIPHKEYGLPVDEKWLEYPRFFRGDVLFAFNTLEEFDQYIASRTDIADRS